MRVCLVTGSAKRMGRAITQHLVTLGFSPIIHYSKSVDEALDFQKELKSQNVKSWLLEIDLSDPDFVYEKLSKFLRDKEHLPSVLVNCAAAFEYDDAESVSYRSLGTHADTNLFSPILLTKALLEERTRRGEQSDFVVINVLDFKLYNPAPDYFSYTLSKAGLRSATELLARGIAKKQARVCSVSPGFTLPAPSQSEEDFQSVRDNTPLGYGPSAQDVSDAVGFLVNNKAVTGIDIVVDSGLRFRSFDRDVVFELGQE